MLKFIHTIGLLLLAGLLWGCSGTPFAESPMASSISRPVHSGLVLSDSRLSLPPNRSDSWEFSRNDVPAGGKSLGELPGATVVEIRRRDRLHTSNGRPHTHFHQTTTIRERRIDR